MYFKGFIAFSLWGFIPPPGGEMHKSKLIQTLQYPKRLKNKAGGRNDTKSKKNERSQNLKELEYQGTPKDLRSKESEMQGIQYIIINGRKEAQK